MKAWTDAVIEEIGFTNTEHGKNFSPVEDDVYTQPNGNPYCGS